MTETEQRSSLVFSRDIKKIANLDKFFPEFNFEYSFSKNTAQVIGWGINKNSIKARNFASSKSLPYIALEDGFIRSLGLADRYQPLSLIADDLGLYYDATNPSRLEQLIFNAPEEDNPAAVDLYSSAKKAREFICKFGISKYNHAPDLIYETKSEIVLVIDQVAGDNSLTYGLTDDKSFQRMLDAAILENPEKEIWIKTHPATSNSKKQGLADIAAISELNNPRIRIITADFAPQSLINLASKVYTLTSQFGFEALLAGKPVVTFGVPWYSAWGLTDDRHEFAKLLSENQERRRSRSVLQIFAAAYLQYCRYLNPDDSQAGTIFDLLEYLKKMRRLTMRMRGEFYAVDFSLSQKATAKSFFNLPQTTLRFINKEQAREIPKNSAFTPQHFLVWGSVSDNNYEEIDEIAREKQFPLWQMEDGFIRSVGLSSNLTSPISVVMDDLGIYFDARRPSRLEYLLQNAHISLQELEEARTLREYLIANSISKYNIAAKSELAINPRQKQKIILVLGQVEDDASVRYGLSEVKKNSDLLALVRRREPKSYIIYKPHPDVETNNRQGAIEEWKVKQYANVNAANTDIFSLINIADEVHTISSLAGFEALIRGKKVVCYGAPFYAGWGLTQDLRAIQRRTRRLTINQMLAVVMMKYPLYIDPNSGNSISPLRAAQILRLEKSKAQAFANADTGTRYKEKFRRLVSTIKQTISN
ncbi:MAG: capsular polysaccharide biosynthesis protein [Cardiobacteriaceae bacterium]|nr:capsular polysaccharide biosynthesis protein [Cardiobacteriaceae bacterium]